MPETAKIVVEKIPEPGTDDMIAMVHSVLEQVLSQLPFPFMDTDVMSAATALLIDAGMISVMDGGHTKDTLADEICGVIRGAIDEWRPEHSNVTSSALQERVTN